MHSLLFHPYTVVSFAETLHSIWFTSGLCAMEMVTALDGMCFPSMTQFQWGSFNFLTWFVWWLHLVRRWYKVGCYFVLPLIWDVCSIYIRFSESHRLPLTCPRRWWNVFFFFLFLLQWAEEETIKSYEREEFLFFFLVICQVLQMGQLNSHMYEEITNTVITNFGNALQRECPFLHGGTYVPCTKSISQGDTFKRLLVDGKCMVVPVYSAILALHVFFVSTHSLSCRNGKS